MRGATPWQPLRNVTTWSLADYLADVEQPVTLPLPVQLVPSEMIWYAAFVQIPRG